MVQATAFGAGWTLLLSYRAALERNRGLTDAQRLEAQELLAGIEASGLPMDPGPLLVERGLLPQEVFRALWRVAIALGEDVPELPRPFQDFSLADDRALTALVVRHRLVPLEALRAARGLRERLRRCGVELRWCELLFFQGQLRADIVPELRPLIAARDPAAPEANTAAPPITADDLLFARIVIAKGLVEAAEVQGALVLQRPARERTGLKLTLGDVLYGLGLVAAEQLDSIYLVQQARGRRGGLLPAVVHFREDELERLDEVLEQRSLVSPEVLGEAGQVEARLRQMGMRRPLPEILVLLGHLQEVELYAALDLQKARQKRSHSAIRVSFEPVRLGPRHRSSALALPLTVVGSLTVIGLGWLLFQEGRQGEDIAGLRRAWQARLDQARENPEKGYAPAPGEVAPPPPAYARVEEPIHAGSGPLGGAQTYLDLAALLRTQGHYEEERRAVEAALRLAPQFAPARAALAIIEERERSHEDPRRPWEVLGRHIALRTDVSETAARRYHDHLAAVFNRFRELLDVRVDPAEVWSRPLQVTILRDRAAFDALRQSWAPAAGEGEAWRADAEAGELLAVHEATVGGAPLEAVLGAAGRLFEHVSLRGRVSPLPPWLAEGLADYLAAASWDADRQQLLGLDEPPTSLREAVQALAEVEPWPELEAFIESRATKLPPQDRARAWALVRLLALDAAQTGPGPLAQYYKSVGNGATPLESFRECFGETAAVNLRLKSQVQAWRPGDEGR